MHSLPNSCSPLTGLTTSSSFSSFVAHEEEEETMSERVCCVKKSEDGGGGGGEGYVCSDALLSLLIESRHAHTKEEESCHS